MKKNVREKSKKSNKFIVSVKGYMGKGMIVGTSVKDLENGLNAFAKNVNDEVEVEYAYEVVRELKVEKIKGFHVE